MYLIIEIGRRLIQKHPIVQSHFLGWKVVNLNTGDQRRSQTVCKGEFLTFFSGLGGESYSYEMRSPTFRPHADTNPALTSSTYCTGTFEDMLVSLKGWAFS